MGRLLQALRHPTPEKRGILSSYILYLPVTSPDMSKIQLDNINIKTPQSSMSSPIVLDITFTALEPLPLCVSWKVIYVGSAFSEEYDQVLQEVEIQKIAEASTLSFQLQCPPPNFQALPKDELICTTAMILCGSYINQEFIRVGYYIHNWIQSEEAEGLTVDELVEKAQRTIISEKPRITKFEILWGEEQTLTQKIGLLDQEEREGGAREGEEGQKGQIGLQVTEEEEKISPSELQTVQKKAAQVEGQHLKSE